MGALEELVSGLSGPSRAVVISETEVSLKPGAADNRIFLLSIGEGSLAAGGRGGGFGERRVTAVRCFELRSGVWSKVFQAEEERASEFEVPYHVSRLPLILADGGETMGYGVVEKELVAEFSKRAGISSSA